jgi:hypothetical protein
MKKQDRLVTIGVVIVVVLALQYKSTLTHNYMTEKHNSTTAALSLT